MIRALALLVAVAVPVMGPASAQDPAAARRAAEAERAAAVRAAEQAQEAATQEARLAAERVAGAARVQQAEREAEDATERVEAARRGAEEARAEQQRLAAEIAPLIPMLMRIATQPAPLLLAAPLSPEEVMLSLGAIRMTLREAREKAALLRESEARATREAVVLTREQRRLAQARAQAEQASVALDAQLTAARQVLAERNAAERQAASRAEAAVRRARSIEEALARLEREQAEEARREAEEAKREAERARQRAVATATAAATPRPVPQPAPRATAEPASGMPVAGQLIREFNAPGEGGPARGLTFAAQPGARVTAPCGGSVAFAAPFRSYGRMVILDCGGGQHLVLAGMDRLDVSGGQRVRAGEPVGVLPGTNRPTLYVELRRRGEAVDPRPWLRAGA